MKLRHDVCPGVLQISRMNGEYKVRVHGRFAYICNARAVGFTYCFRGDHSRLGISQFITGACRNRFYIHLSAETAVVNDQRVYIIFTISLSIIFHVAIVVLVRGTQKCYDHRSSF